MSQQNSVWASLKTLIDPKTIPFLISQGVLPKLLPVGTLLVGIIAGFIWAYVISPTVYTGAGPVNLSDTWKQEYLKQVAWQYAANGDQQGQDNAKHQIAYLGDGADVLNQMIATNTDSQLAGLLNNLKPLAANDPDQLAKVTPGLLNNNIMPFLCIIGAAVIFGGAIVVNTIIPVSLLFQRRSKERSTVQQGLDADRRKAMDAAKKSAADLPADSSPGAVDRGTPVG